MKGEAVVAKFTPTASDGKTYQIEYFNHDMILSVAHKESGKMYIIKSRALYCAFLLPLG